MLPAVKRQSFQRRLLVSLVSFGVAGQAPMAMAQSPGRFAATGNLSTGRFSHTATLLPNGKVLTAGGVYSHPTIPIDAFFDVLASAELYDPSTGMFTPAGSMTKHRASHTATLLANGKVLIVGGAILTTGERPSSAELYDPATGTFTATGDTTTARLGGHTATLLKDGRVLIVGGSQDGGSAEVYDPSTGTFAPTANTIGRHPSGGTALLPGGQVFVVGGSQGAELYDPARESFVLAGGGAYPSEVPFTATLLISGKVLDILGYTCDDCGDLGGDAELYDPLTNTFTATAHSIGGGP